MIELLLNAENELALGLLDEAERTYRTVLEADPRNGIAAVGLSRVALQRGDETGAHALARAALEIDPQNATARRMIDRLDEVARYREEAPAGRDTRASATLQAGTAAGSGPEPAPPAGRAPSAGKAPPAAAVPPAGPAPSPETESSAAAARQAAPTRPGLLRRILRRS